jgi:hypothetical protein
MKLDKPQSWTGWGGEKKKKIPSLPCQELNPSCPAHSLVSVLTKINGKDMYKNWG